MPHLSGDPGPRGLLYVSSRKLNIVQDEGWVRIGFGFSWVLVVPIVPWWGVAWGINVSHVYRINVLMLTLTFT